MLFPHRFIVVQDRMVMTGELRSHCSIYDYRPDDVVIHRRESDVSEISQWCDDNSIKHQYLPDNGVLRILNGTPDNQLLAFTLRWM